MAFVFIDVCLRGPISTLVARLQLPRAAWVVDLLGLVYVAHLLRRAWAERRAPRPLVLILVGALLVSPSDFAPLEPIWVVVTPLLVGGARGRPLAAPSRSAALSIWRSAVLAAAQRGRVRGASGW